MSESDPAKLPPVLCTYCGKPILTTGTGFRGRPVHIWCFYILRERSEDTRDDDAEREIATTRHDSKGDDAAWQANATGESTHTDSR